MRAWIRTNRERIRALLDRARRERSTPREIGLAVGVGVLVGCTPFFYLHMWIALALATALRLNRLWAFIGSRCSTLPVFALIGFCEVQSAHRLRTGAWASLSPRQLREIVGRPLREIVAPLRELMTDWLLGAAFVGSGLALLAGLVAYAAARQWHKRVTARRLAGSLPPSSESPPSAPRSPTP